MRWMQLAKKAKSDMWELFHGKTDWFKATRCRIGSFDLTVKPCQAFPFLVFGDMHRNCIIQCGSSFMTRQIGKAKGYRIGSFERKSLSKCSSFQSSPGCNQTHFQEARKICYRDMEKVRIRNIRPFQGE